MIVGGCFSRGALFCLFVLGGLLCWGCCSERSVVTAGRADTVAVSVAVHDTACVETVRLVERTGDTVRVTETVERWRVVWRWRDSVRAVHDTVRVETARVVERGLTWLERLKVGAFWWLVGVLVVVVVLAFWRRIV